MTHPSPQPPPSATVIREMNLGQHTLILLSDQRIELMPRESEPSAVQTVLSLEGGEAYRLLIALQDMFQEAEA